MMRDRTIPETQDLAGGDTLDEDTERNVQFYREQVRYVTRLRWATGAVAVVTLLLLGWSLFTTLGTFNSQLVKATGDVTKIVSADADGSVTASAGSSKPSGNNSGAAATTRTSAAGAGVSSTNPSAPNAAPTPAPAVAATIKLDISSIANSVVAIVSILVLAIGVIVISLLRMAFSVVPEKLGGSEQASSENGSDVTTLGLEAMKIIGEAIADLITRFKK